MIASPRRAVLRLLVSAASLALTSSVAAQESGRFEIHPWGRSVATLTEAGQEPRVHVWRRPTARPLELEYRFDQQLSLEAEEGENTLSRSSEYPLLGIHVVAKTEELENGQLRQRLEVKEGAFVQEASTTPPVKRDVQAQVEAVRGLTLEWLMEPDGSTVGESVTLTGNLSSPALALVLMDEMAMDWALALPDEPVGVGARWTTRGNMPVHMVGPAFRADSTLSLEVKEIANGVMKLAVGIHRVASELGVAPGTLPPAENYSCEGQGEMVIDLSSGMVIGAQMQRVVDARVPMGDTGHSLNLHIEMVTLVVRREDLPEHVRTGAQPVAGEGE